VSPTFLLSVCLTLDRVLTIACCRFESGFPMELEGRVSRQLNRQPYLPANAVQLTPQQWNAFIDSINDQMAQAYSVKGAVIDNVIAIATWWTSVLWRTSHFEKVSVSPPMMVPGLILLSGTAESRRDYRELQRNNFQSSRSQCPFTQRPGIAIREYRLSLCVAVHSLIIWCSWKSSMFMILILSM
jgi:hypothetical protein